MSRHRWLCVKCEWPQTSPLAPRFYDHLCAACDSRTADERREARSAMLPPLRTHVAEPDRNDSDMVAHG